MNPIATLDARLAGLRALYLRHFADRPRATRSQVLVEALASEAAELCLLADQHSSGAHDAVWSAATLLRAEADAIRSETLDPLGTLCADVTTSGLIVEAQFRRLLRQSEVESRSALQLGALHGDAVAVLTATRELEESLPPDEARRWQLEVETLVAQIAGAARSCQGEAAAMAGDREQARSALALSLASIDEPTKVVMEALNAGCGDALWLHGEAERVLKLTDAAKDPTLTIAGLRAAAQCGDWAGSAESRAAMCGESLLADCEAVSAPLVTHVFASLPCASLSLSSLSSMPIALDVLGGLHRIARRELVPDAVYCTLPWLNDVRDALLVGERWLARGAAVSH